MEFEEFLKKEAIQSDDSIAYSEFKEKGSLIPTKSLGEWAWKEIIKCENKSVIAYNQLYERKGEYYTYMGSFYIEIAVACLGKSEIEKRLKELKN